jgi:hypothetical protein
VDEYFKPYGMIELQRRMVSDGYRTDAFARAIREVVRPTSSWTWELELES